MLPCSSEIIIEMGLEVSESNANKLICLLYNVTKSYRIKRINVYHIAYKT